MKQTSLIFFLILFNHCFSQTITSKKVVANDSLYIHFINPYVAPIGFKITPKDSLKDQFIVKERFQIKPKDTFNNVFRLPLRLIEDTAKVKVSKFVNIKGTLGKSKIDPDYDYKYALPYPKGKSYKIMQTFGGGFSHNLKHSKYAIDFTIPIGDTITAVRNGIVVYTVDTFKERGGREFMGKANKIIIMHDDDTFAHYVHLDYKGLLVKEGDKIKKGQPIGISGFTGFTTKPHLHLVLFKEESESIPFYFKKLGKKVLKKGKFYKNR